MADCTAFGGGAASRKDSCKTVNAPGKQGGRGRPVSEGACGTSKAPAVKSSPRLSLYASARLAPFPVRFIRVQPNDNVNFRAFPFHRSCTKKRKRFCSRFLSKRLLSGWIICRSSASADPQSRGRGGPRRGPSHQNLRFAWFCTGASRSSKFAKPLKFLHLSSVFDTSFEHHWYIYH